MCAHSAEVIRFFEKKNRRKTYFFFLRKIRQVAYSCKKNMKPNTRQSRKREPNSASTPLVHDDKGNNEITKRAKIQNNGQKRMTSTGESSDITSSDTSKENVSNGEVSHGKLNSIVDKLQDHEW